jgi:hypothetical protein
VRKSYLSVGTFFFFLVSLLSGCNIARHQFSNLNISLSPSGSVAVDGGQSVTVTATVTGDPTNSGVIWSLTGPGSLANRLQPA